MKNLSIIYIVKISVTLVFWCIPLLIFPETLLTAMGFPPQETYMFLRLLGCAYLALCVGYYVGLRAALKGDLIKGPIYVGICSNGSACLLLLYYGLSGEWSSWGGLVQFIMWSSIPATFLITLGLYTFGLKAKTYDKK